MNTYFYPNVTNSKQTKKSLCKCEVKIMAYHFNTRVEIIEERQSEDSFLPDEVEEYSVAKPWADIRTIKGSEYYEANVTANKIPLRFIIRYREGITTKQKVKYKGDLYNIESVQNDNAMNQTLTIFAVNTK